MLTFFVELCYHASSFDFSLLVMGFSNFFFGEIAPVDNKILVNLELFNFPIIKEICTMINALPLDTSHITNKELSDWESVMNCFLGISSLQVDLKELIKERNEDLVRTYIQGNKPALVIERPLLFVTLLISLVIRDLSQHLCDPSTFVRIMEKRVDMIKYALVSDFPYYESDSTGFNYPSEFSSRCSERLDEVLNLFRYLAKGNHLVSLEA